MNKTDTNNKILLMSIALIAGLFLTIAGITYTWFNVVVKSLEDTSGNVVIKAADLGTITFYNGEEISMSEVFPGWCETKKVSIKSEGATTANNYSIYLNIGKNELAELGSTYGYVTMKNTVVDSESQVTTGSIAGENLQNVVATSGKALILTGEIGSTEIHTYNIEFCFPELGIDQNSQQGKAFNAYLSVDSGTKTQGIDTDIASANNVIDSELNNITASILTCIKNDYNNNDTCGYGEVSNLVGKEIPIYLEDYGRHTLRIANTSTPDECLTTGFSQSACGLVFEFSDIIALHDMNPSGVYNEVTYDEGANIGSWPASGMYNIINGTDDTLYSVFIIDDSTTSSAKSIYMSISENIRNMIIDTTVVSGHGKDDSANFTSTDKLYLLDLKEVYGSTFTSSSNTAKEYERQLDYYLNQTVTTNNYLAAIKRYNNASTIWWLRSAYLNEDVFSFSAVSFDGNRDAHWANSDSIGIAPAFRIG
jgi:hypothetical protein